jgi:hypothetical protein
MSLTNSAEPAVREAVARQDLDNVLHPIVQHKALESKQIVASADKARRSLTPMARAISMPWLDFGA